MPGICCWGGMKMVVVILRASKKDWNRDFKLTKENGEKIEISLTKSYQIYDPEKIRRFLKDVDVVKGDTYYFRNLLKELGFKFDWQNKIWSRKLTAEDQAESYKRKLIREIAEHYLVEYDFTLRDLGEEEADKEIWQQIKEDWKGVIKKYELTKMEILNEIKKRVKE